MIGHSPLLIERIRLERRATEGESPVGRLVMEAH